MTETAPAFLAGGGEMGGLIRSHDWAATPLGPPEHWPQVLQTLTTLMLASSQPMFVVWGPERTTLYNDAYGEILAGKHPALGQPFDRIWREIWESDLEPIVARAYAGEALHMGDIPLVMHRKGYPEETHFSFSYTPVRDAAGAVQGFFCPCLEITEQVLEQRRIGLRTELTERLRAPADPSEIALDAAALLARYLRADGAVYAEVDESGEHLVIAHGPRDGRAAGPAERHRLKDFGAAVAADLQAGLSVAVDEVREESRTAAPEARATFARRGVRAFLIVPHIRQGRLEAVLAIHSQTPRHWHAAEIALAEEVAERVHVELERTRAEAALRDSEARLRKVLDIETVGVVFFDLVGGIRDANDAFLASIGYSRDELEAGQVRYENLTPPDWRWRDEQTIADLLASGKAGPYEKEYCRKDGSIIWILCAAKMLDDETAVEFVLDVTQRKSTEAALRESEQRHAFLLQLSDALRAHSGARESMRAAAEVLGRHLGVAYVGYAEVDASDGVRTEGEYHAGEEMPGFAGKVFPLEGFGAVTADRLRNGETVREVDVQASERFSREERLAVGAIGVRSYIAAPLLLKGRLDAYLFAAHDAPRQWSEQEIALLRDTAERTFAAVQRARAEADLDESEAQFRALVNSTSNIVYRMSPDGAEMRELNSRGWIDDTEQARQNWMDDYILPDDRHLVRAAIEEAVHTGGPFDLEHRVRRADGTIGWVHSRAVPLVGDDGAIVEWLGAANDVTDRKRAEEHQTMLMAELDHRVKNILAVVQSIAWQTVGKEGGAGTGVAERFIGRLSALAQSHNLLADSRWEGASLRDLVATAVAPYRGDGTRRIRIEGPDLQVTPKAAQTLTLVLHELVTNAAKYGALSNEAGRVIAQWDLREDGNGGRLLFRWTEQDGPPVEAPPSRRGFGSRLIESTPTFEFGGEVTLDFAHEGLRAVFDLPLMVLARRGGRHRDARQPREAAAAGNRAVLEGKRVLVVEDEHLVANEVAQALGAVGCSIAGPVSNLACAVHAAEAEDLDAAVLDINLAGEFVWPAARALRARGIPFAFATGYSGTVEPPPELADTPRIQKPVPPERVLALLAALVENG